MKITFDIIISGCLTHCRHCYVNGGPAKFTSTKHLLNNLPRIKNLINMLEDKVGTVDIWFDYEPLSHPEFATIVTAFKKEFPSKLDFTNMEWPTTGISLLRHSYRNGVNIIALRQLNVHQIFFTFAGYKDSHNQHVKRQHAFEDQIEAIKLLHGLGFRPSARILLTNDIVHELPLLFQTLQTLPLEHRSIRVSDYVPTDRIRSLEQFRPTVEDVFPYLDSIIAFCNDHTQLFWEDFEMYSEAALCEKILKEYSATTTFEDIESCLPEWIFLTLDSDLRLYHGNAGQFTWYIGSVVENRNKKIIEKIIDFGPNYHYAAFFKELKRLPIPLEVLKREPYSGRKIYGNEHDFLLKCLDEYMENHSQLRKSLIQ
ncbi:MAG: radical SAM protein [Candidatus Marinimicrobia bacterium]|nr:radical SAM protein [bacterium]MCG2715549.1 radical SAM protein [Candidatus Neomarinimicrobiota bacterium]